MNCSVEVATVVIDSMRLYLFFSIDVVFIR